jgi:hypothetical protein
MPANDRKPFFADGLLGPSPRRTAIKLVMASLIVGLILAFLGVSPTEFWRGVWNFVSGIVGLIGDTAGEVALNLGAYVLFGAAIVVPVWVAMRLLNGDRRGSPRVEAPRRDGELPPP